MSKVVRVFLVLILIASAGSAWASNPPIVQWQPPSSYTPARGAGRITTLTDSSSPIPFIALTACRQYDSRNSTSLAQNTVRAVPLSGAPCGIPTQAQAVALNITVFNISGASGNAVFLAGNVNPPTTAWINYPSTETQRANAGVIPVAAGGTLYVEVEQGAGHVDFVVDVYGYYSSTAANQSNYFSIFTNSGGYAIYAQNSSTTCAGPCGVEGNAFSGYGVAGYSSKGHGVYGSSSTAGDGVYGISQDASGAGVHGVLTSNVSFSAAVRGEHQSTGGGGIGVYGSHAGSGWGVYGTTTGAGIGVLGVSGGYGVEGASSGSASNSYGVYGNTASTANGAAGVFGTDGASATGGISWFSAGVRGQGKNGVVGVSSTSIGYGVVGEAAGSAADGVYSQGNFAASGTKAFVEPDPVDPSLVIKYVALEGPEAGTYFRGTARTTGGEAVIDVPVSFRDVTAEDGLTVQLTPFQGYAELYVESEDLNQIVVHSSRDVTFHYQVNGVRRAFKDFQAIAPGNYFIPISPDSKMPSYLTDEAKKRLIANGTYNADGTVNMATAQRMGWTTMWAEQKAASEKAAQANAQALKAAMAKNQTSN